ncbi:hypothetical protein FQN57_006748 [Myotisia sp. PD_48]|nr:hypothetical protein FQN57_006748 [Myotisia sp. PD_48]
MRIRYPFAGAFSVLLLLSAYLGLLPHSTPDAGGPKTPSMEVNDKLLHFFAFFALSIAFYWILDTSRRRILHVTVVVCTLVLGVGSELLQASIPNGRSFDPYDILANLIGSLSAIALCTWYHKRMLARRRKSRFGTLLDESGRDDDLELGVSQGTGEQQSGVTGGRTLEDEVDNWDENAVDTWEEDEEMPEGPRPVSEGTGPTKTPSAGSDGKARSSDDIKN